MLLASDIVERIVDTRSTAALAQLQKPFPLRWERQRIAEAGSIERS